MAKGEDDDALARRSNAWTDLGLTLPLFLVYHLGVVFLNVRNAADPVTHELQVLAHHSLAMYAGLTLAIGTAFVVVLSILGRGKTFKLWRFGVTAGEGALYAMLMRAAAAYVVGSLALAQGAPAPAPGGTTSAFPAVIMALGAGFYEEIAFRVGIFGLGALVIRHFVGTGPRRVVLTIVWGLIESCLFSAWHYVGPLADPFSMQSFVFRAVCGAVLTTIFALRGFAPAVWTHALYDVWAMVLR